MGSQGKQDSAHLYEQIVLSLLTPLKRARAKTAWRSSPVFLDRTNTDPTYYNITSLDRHRITFWEYFQNYLA